MIEPPATAPATPRATATGMTVDDSILAFNCMKPSTGWPGGSPPPLLHYESVTVA
jgi:hypothetical protein